MENAQFEALLESKILQAESDDPAHDILHFRRVVAMAKNLALLEGGKLEVVIPAAWLHDFVIIPKNDPRRSLASQLSANAAVSFLRELGYPEKFLPAISHAIEAHSFSANIECKSLEAKIVQDADRLDGLGAIGIARCFATAGLLRRSFYAPLDPFCSKRDPDDGTFTVDHFYRKLFRVVDTLKTTSGKKEGLKRAEVMRSYLVQLEREVCSTVSQDHSVPNCLVE